MTDKRALSVVPKPVSAVLAAFAVALVLALGVGQAWAYFTATDSVSGSVLIQLEPSTDITERYDEAGKHVIVTNDADAGAAVHVRARTFSSLPVEAAGEGWSQDGDWFYYDAVLAPGESTSELAVAITFPVSASADADAGENYNVVVVYEATPVQYKPNGKPLDADWDIVLDSGTAEGR